MSKIVFIDVDGTLVDYENHLPDSAVREYSRRKGRSARTTVRQSFPDMIFGGELYRDDLKKV